MESDANRTAYLDLMKRCLVNFIYADAEYWAVIKPRGWFSRSVIFFINLFGMSLVRYKPFDEAVRTEGSNWPPPPFAHSMIGLKRMDNIQDCIEDILAKDVPGDFMEAGVWRGGAIIFMRAVLKAYGISDRVVWGADSFHGLPKPDVGSYPQDKGMKLHEADELSVSVNQVKRNFDRYGLLDEQVKFIEGWFSDTLPGAQLTQLALIRVDADMYKSTMDALTYLYPKLSAGGYVIIDDYGAIEACRQAVDDFRTNNKITEELVRVDYSGVYWRREKILTIEMEEGLE